MTVIAFLLCVLDIPYKYGPQGGCADHSVFGMMRKYQMIVEEVIQVRFYYKFVCQKFVRNCACVFLHLRCVF